eukprot:359555-Chlamydomonas_euryale.AAC.11
MHLAQVGALSVAQAQLLHDRATRCWPATAVAAARQLLKRQHAVRRHLQHERWLLHAASHREVLRALRQLHHALLQLGRVAIGAAERQHGAHLWAPARLRRCAKG